MLEYTKPGLPFLIDAPSSMWARMNGWGNLANRRILEVQLFTPPNTTQFPPADHSHWFHTAQPSAFIGRICTV